MAVEIEGAAVRDDSIDGSGAAATADTRAGGKLVEKSVVRGGRAKLHRAEVQGGRSAVAVASRASQDELAVARECQASGARSQGAADRSLDGERVRRAEDEDDGLGVAVAEEGALADAGTSGGDGRAGLGQDAAGSVRERTVVGDGEAAAGLEGQRIDAGGRHRRGGGSDRQGAGEAEVLSGGEGGGGLGRGDQRTETVRRRRIIGAELRGG